MNRTTLLAVLVFALLVSVVRCAQAELRWADNGLNGHVYLTDEPCDLHNSMPMRPMYRAYSVLNENTPQEAQIEGCWHTPEVDLNDIPEEHRGRTLRIIKFVYLLAPDQQLYRREESDFTPVPPVKGAF
jgi:hypothetical protein